VFVAVPVLVSGVAGVVAARRGAVP
jgi:hypothetical protein